MIIRRYETPQIFLAIYEELLLEQEAATQLLLHNAYQKLIVPVCPSCIFGAVLKEEEPVLLFCNVLPHNLVLYAMKKDEGIAAVEELASFIWKEDIKINGVNGQQALCQKFIEVYSQWNGAAFVEHLALDIMEVRELQEMELIDGHQRKATEEDGSLVTDWVIQYKMETKTVELNYEEAMVRVRRWIGEEKLYLYINDSHVPVSMVVIVRKLLHGLGMGYAYTPDEYRGNGYAVANVYHLCKAFLRDDVEFCSLFVDRKNQVSHRAYEKIGFQFIEDHYEYRLLEMENLKGKNQKEEG